MKHVRKTPEATYHLSAGGVVVSALAPDAEIALLHRVDGEWTLPKGHLEGDESTREAALREIEEEIGLRDLEIISDLGTTRYTFQKPDDPLPHHKEVAFHLVLSSRGRLPLIPEDNPKFDCARWIPSEEAERLCTYPEFQDVIRRARKALLDPSSNQKP